MVMVKRNKAAIEAANLRAEDEVQQILATSDDPTAVHTKPKAPAVPVSIPRQPLPKTKEPTSLLNKLLKRKQATSPAVQNQQNQDL